MTESWEQLGKTIIHKKTSRFQSVLIATETRTLKKKECLEKASQHRYQSPIQRSWAPTKQTEESVPPHPSGAAF